MHKNDWIFVRNTRKNLAFQMTKGLAFGIMQLSRKKGDLPGLGNR